MGTEMMKKQAEELENRRERYWLEPLVDVYENAEDILVVADVPGVAKEALNVQIADGQLTITGERRVSELGTPLRAEYEPFGFRRSFAVNQDIDLDAVTASLDGGVLTLKLPKHERVKARTIKVTAG